MADKKITELTSTASVIGADIFPTVINIASTPETRKITVSGLVNSIKNLAGFTPASHNTSHQSGGSDVILLDNLGAPEDNTDLNVTISGHGLMPKLPNNQYQFFNGVGQWTIMGLVDGWISANESWTYASANTINVPAGAASKYAVGDRIKWTQTTVKYGVIITVADTLLTIAINTNYTVANAAISANFYSHELSPVGYPEWFDYTPSLTGWSSNCKKRRKANTVNGACRTG